MSGQMSGWREYPGVPSAQDWMGYPHQYLMWYPPVQDWMGVHPPPHIKDWMGYPFPSRDSSIVSTCYAAGGMPLAFTQEDFLVAQNFGNFFAQSEKYYLTQSNMKGRLNEVRMK